MYLQTKEEIKRHIGNKPFLRKLPRTNSFLGYVSGIQELSIQKKSGEPTPTFSITQYPNGLLITDRKGKYRIGLPYSELRSIEIVGDDADYYQLTFTTLLSKPLIFSFQRKDRLHIVPFIKLLSYKEEGDPRDEHTAREEILRLKEKFASDYLTDRTFCQELKSVAKKNVLLDINEHRIIYGDRVMDVSQAVGYITGIEEVNYHGVSRFQYNANIYHPEEHMFVSFTSVSAFLKEGEHSQVLNQIGRVLFDIISRPIVARWLDKFANGEHIDYKEFALTRQGMLLKTRTPGILIHWDELVAQGPGMFRWPYGNTVFQPVGPYDLHGNMLLFLITWLQRDPERLVALMGRKYYIS